MVFPKKSPSEQMAISDREMVCPINSGSARRIIFKLLLDARGQDVHESYINGFSEKFLFGANGPFLGPKMARPDTSGSAFRIFCKFCTMAGTMKVI